MEGLVFESDVPPEHPRKREMEDALREVMHGLAGSWKVQVSRARIGYWIGVRIQGPGLDWTLILEPREQNAESIHHRVGAVLWAVGQRPAGTDRG